MDPEQGTFNADTTRMNNIQVKDDVSIRSVPESDLQSLGFIVNNGRPRFRLDEPTMTGSTLGFTVVDEDGTLSFEILGKDSLHIIQELSHASYVDIQQKSKSIDYSSIVSTLSTSQIQNKLTELLQENVQLKETLKQNNIAMKQQFNVLAMWQEEVMKVHQNHKQKFVETRELIHHLKKESAELKLKLSTSHCSDAENQFKGVNMSSYDLPKVKPNDEDLSSIKSEKAAGKIAEMDNIKRILQDIQRHLTLYDERNSDLRNAFHMMQTQNCAVKVVTHEMKNEDDISHSFYILNQPSEYIDIRKCIEKCLIKNEEMNQLKEAIDLLEKLLLHDLSLAQQSTENSAGNSIGHGQQQFVQNIKQCEEKLQNLTDCFVTQISRSLLVQECVKECIDILESCSAMKTSEQTDAIGAGNMILLPEEIESLKDKMSKCHKKLVDQQVKIITDRQNIIKAVNEFRKLFSEYNSILYEHKILQEENVKLNTMQDDATRETLQTIIELEKRKDEEMQSLERERDSIAQEKQSLDEEKKSIDSEKQMLFEERRSLENGMQLLLQERINLHQEKVSLDQQSQLYENHRKAVQVEKEVLESNHEKLIARMNELEKDSETIKVLRQQIADQLQHIEILRTQLAIYEEDFKKEKQSVESLTAEKIKLTNELRKQVQINKDSHIEVERLLRLTGQHLAANFWQQTQSRSQQDDVNVEQLLHYSCPKCEREFPNIQLLEEHVERCLNLQ